MKTLYVENHPPFSIRDRAVKKNAQISFFDRKNIFRPAVSPVYPRVTRKHVNCATTIEKLDRVNPRGTERARDFNRRRINQ